MKKKKKPSASVKPVKPASPPADPPRTRFELRSGPAGEAFFEEIAAAADRVGESVSQWLRGAARERLSREKRERGEK